MSLSDILYYRTYVLVWQEERFSGITGATRARKESGANDV